MKDLQIKCDTEEQMNLCLDKLSKDHPEMKKSADIARRVIEWDDKCYVILIAGDDLINYAQNKVEPTKMDALQYLNR